MRGISKKMFISILTSVIVMVTMVATTFAWVGIFTYANTEKFNINLKVSELDVNYYLTISSSGNKGTFSDTVELSDIERQILINQNKWSIDKINSLSDLELDAFYSRNCYTTPSTVEIENNNLSDFKAIELTNVDRFRYYTPQVPYLKFDLFLSVDTKEGIQDTSIINSNVYLTELEQTLIGTLSSYKFYNGNQFKNLPSTNELLKTLPDLGTFKINSKNAARVALCIYNPINIQDSYTDEKAVKTIIYYSGNQEPSLDGDVYDLGGNLPEDYNTALKELLVIRPNYKINNNISYVRAYEDALNNAIERGKKDLSLTEENAKIWEKPYNPKIEVIDGKYIYNYLGVQDGIQTKQKISVYLWFEGWDSDCLSGIEQKPVNLNLNFTAGIED